MPEEEHDDAGTPQPFSSGVPTPSGDEVVAAASGDGLPAGETATPEIDPSRFGAASALGSQGVRADDPVTERNAPRTGASFSEWASASAQPQSPERGEWHPDPTGRHGERYFVGSLPTALVRNEGTESVDPEGERILLTEVNPRTGPGNNPAARPRTRRRRRMWIGIALAAIVVIAVAAIAGTALLLMPAEPDTDGAYIAAMRKAGVLGQFPNDASAIAHAKKVCRSLDRGSLAQGTEADRVGVMNYCEQYKRGFHVLETITVDGTFTLIDSSPGTYYPSISSIGSICEGDNGYGDVTAGTTVSVKDENGKLLTQTNLRSGLGSRTRCQLGFSFRVTEGAKQYVISVGRRGELSYTFAQLKNQGVSLSLGS